MKPFMCLNVLTVFSLNSLCQIQDALGVARNESETVTPFDMVSVENTEMDVLSSTQALSTGENRDQVSPHSERDVSDSANSQGWFNCDGRCGRMYDKPFWWKGHCYCDAACFVFNDCCDDIEHSCPALKNLANETFGPDLMVAESECDNKTGVSVINSCPATVLDKGESLDFFQSNAFVFDQATGILYRNEKVFQCYSSPAHSQPLVWKIEMGLVLTDITNLTNVFKHVRDDNFRLVPPGDWRAAGRQCNRGSFSKGFKFSMLLSRNLQSGTLDISTEKRTLWSKIECGKSGACEQKECVQNAERRGKKCMLFTHGRVFFLHPAYLLPWDFIENLVSYFRCFLKKDTFIVNADFRNIQRIAFISNQSKTNVIRPGFVLFSFDVSIISTLPFYLKQLVHKASVFFMQYEKLVERETVGTILRYRSALPDNSRADASRPVFCAENSNTICLKDKVVDLSPLSQLEKAEDNPDYSPVAFCVMEADAPLAPTDNNRCTRIAGVLYWNCRAFMTKSAPRLEVPTACGYRILVCGYLPLLIIFALVQKFY